MSSKDFISTSSMRRRKYVPTASTSSRKYVTTASMSRKGFVLTAVRNYYMYQPTGVPMARIPRRVAANCTTCKDTWQLLIW